MSGKTIGEQIADLKATRADVQKRMEAVVQKSIDEARSMNDAETAEFDSHEAQIKTLDGDIERFSRLEAMQAKTAKPVEDVAKSNATRLVKGSQDVNTVQIKNTEKLEPGIGMARYARVKALAFTGQAGTRNEIEIAQNLYPGDDSLVKSLTKAAVPAANTLSTTWAGNLINDGGVAFADFVEYLRERSLYGQISSRFHKLPFDIPVLVQGSGGSASWTKEGEAKPLTSWTYTRAKLTPLKVTSIAAATKEMLNRASAAGDALIRDELTRAVNARIDGTLISEDAAVTDESPAGLLAGTAAITLTGDGTAAGIRCDIAQFFKELIGDNLSVAGAFWVMPETVAVDLAMATNEVGAPAFPGITPNGGTLAGLPVFTSQYIPSSDSDGPVVALIKGDEIFLGDEGGIQVSVSDQASLQMDSAPTQDSKSPATTGSTTMVSMWQTNSVAFLVERFLNWQKRRASAVVWAHVNWDACAGSP